MRRLFQTARYRQRGRRFPSDGFVVHILDLQVVDLHCISDAQGDGAFEDVFEFAEIARITVIQEHLLRGGESVYWLLWLCLYRR